MRILISYLEIGVRKNGKFDTIKKIKSNLNYIYEYGFSLRFKKKDIVNS